MSFSECAKLMLPYHSKRLCNIDFIEKITPEILLDNHLTLSRVLLEFNSHIIEFGPDDFARCTWLIWAPLFSPSIVGIDEKSTWQLFEDRGMKTNLIETLNRMDIFPLLVIMTSMAMGQPPSWSSGLHMPKVVSKFLAINKMLLKVNSYLPFNVNELTNPISFGIQKVNWDECIRTFSSIMEYLPPARERLSLLFEWIENNNDQTKQSEIIDQIKKANLVTEFEMYKEQPKKILGILTEPDDEGLIYCPRCGGSLRTNTVIEINRGKLVMCSASSDTWLYKTEKPAKLVL